MTGDGAPSIWLRDATPADLPFVRDLYVSGSRRLLEPLGRWDAAEIAVRFVRNYCAEDTQVIALDGRDIGWLQVSEKPHWFHLHQLHLSDGYRNRGFGSRLIRALQKHARSVRKPVILFVLHDNPAIDLYRRLGFVVVGQDHEKLKMRWPRGPLGV